MKILFGLVLLAYLFNLSFLVFSMPLNETLRIDAKIVTNLEATAEKLINHLSSSNNDKLKHIMSEKNIKKTSMLSSKSYLNAAKGSTSDYIASRVNEISLKNKNLNISATINTNSTSLIAQNRNSNDKKLESEILRLSKSRIKREDIINFIKKKQPQFSVTDANNFLVNAHIDSKISLPTTRDTANSKSLKNRVQAKAIESFIKTSQILDSSRLKNNDTVV